MSAKEPTIKELRQMREQIDAKLTILLAKRNEALSSIAKVMSNFDISIQELTQYLNEQNSPPSSRANNKQTSRTSSASETSVSKRGRKPKSITADPAGINVAVEAQTIAKTPEPEPFSTKVPMTAEEMPDAEVLDPPGNF